MDKSTARSALSCRYSCGILVVAAGNLRRHHHAHQVVGVGAPPYPHHGITPEPHGHDHCGPTGILGCRGRLRAFGTKKWGHGPPGGTT